MRNRLTWRKDRVAARNKTADPYVMNQDPADPSPVDYESGNPSSWAEDLHPVNWKDDYDPRNEIGQPQVDDKTFDHTDDDSWGEGGYDNVTASENDVANEVERKVAQRRDERIAANEKGKIAASVSDRADLAIRVATNILGPNAPEETLKQQSWELMGLPNAHLASMLKRAEDTEEEAPAEEEDAVAVAGDDAPAEDAPPAKDAPAEETDAVATAAPVAGDDAPAEEAAGDDEEMEKEASRLGELMAAPAPVAKSASLVKLIKAAKTAGFKLAKDECAEDDAEMEKEASSFLAGLKALAKKADSDQGKMAARILKAMDEEEMEEEMEKSAGSLYARAYSTRFAMDEEEEAPAEAPAAPAEEEAKEAADLDFELGGMNEVDVTATDNEILAQLFQSEAVESGNEAKTASSTPTEKKGVQKLASATTTGSTDEGFDLTNLWSRAPDVSDVFGT